MSESSKDKRTGRRTTLLGAALKTGAKAVASAGTALRSQPVRRLRGGLRTVAGGLANATRLIRSNSLRGLMLGEVVITENNLNRWFARVEPPDGVASMSLTLHPSRVVLAMNVERRLLGVALGKSTTELPFEIEAVEISSEGGRIELRLDRAAVPEVRGMVRPLIKRLLSRAAADLLDEREPFDRLGDGGDVVRREGDRLIVDVGAYPPFVELMNRELRLIGGTSLFPFRAVVIHGARVEDGRLIILSRLETDQLTARRVVEEIEALESESDEELGFEVEIASSDRAEDPQEESPQSQQSP